MRKTVSLAMVLALGGAASSVAATGRGGFPAPAHQVLVVGTFHFQDAGLDSFKPQYDVDILSEERQRELDTVLGCLADFEPTKIALEVKAERQSEIQASYSSYRAGELELTSNETHQVGFKLAERLGHESVYAVDANARWYEPWVDPDEWAREHGQEHLLRSPLVARYDALYSSEDRAKTEQTLIETLLRLNDPDRVLLGHGRYLIENFPAGNAQEYPGVDSKTAWYNRNLRIFANLQRIAELPAERILLIIGAGHLAILHHAIDASPEYGLVPVSDYLSSGCGAESRDVGR